MQEYFSLSLRTLLLEPDNVIYEPKNQQRFLNPNLYRNLGSVFPYDSRQEVIPYSDTCLEFFSPKITDESQNSQR